MKFYISTFLFLFVFTFLFSQENINPECSIVDLPFSENAQDISGNDNHGTVYGATLIEDRNGNPNSAYYFDGMDDYIECTGDDFNLGLNDYTISVWFRRGSFGVHHNIFSKNRSGELTNRFFLSLQSEPQVSSDADKLYFLTASETGNTWSSSLGFLLETPNSLALEEWYHCVVTREGTAQKMYLNGLEVMSIITGEIYDLSNEINFRIGARYPKIEFGDGPGDVFEGAIDDLKIFNCLLTDSEIEDLYTDVSSSLEDIEIKDEDLSIFPIPTSNELSIGNKKGLDLEEAVIYNSIGKKVYTHQLDRSRQQKLDTSQLPSGLYFLRIGKAYVKKIMIIQPKA